MRHGGGREHSFCICVDDYGLHPGINEAVLRLAEQGVIDATGCMVGAPHWREGAARLRESRLAIDVGLHLDFTEHPFDADLRRGVGPLIVSSYLGLLDVAAVRREVRAQLDAFEAVMGRLPDFVDGHQHVHQLPVIREALLDELAYRYREAKPLLRSTRPPPGAGFKARLIGSLGAARLSALAREAGHPQNGRLLGVYDFRGGPMRYAALLRGWLAAARPGDLLMCHPSARIDADDPLSGARRAEYAVLCAFPFKRS
ncbi:ChbG/HpnK family deacetylase [Paucibacter sp. R3-3]|uniref:ChbG/HpnK family deacetylase n=1 Tax=Roseateles agri TaxID=3098619 RepID=A0ABU5DDU3_9BURK|nr:ChbG/HpnK family deacetylase [Paucibacter sp. R3-3]MDY0744309.1 ChbG/HpnK family deacetylase [Paucibacter sp. R3-3]